MLRAQFSCKPLDGLQLIQESDGGGVRNTAAVIKLGKAQGLVRLLEIIRSELFVGLIERPEEEIQLDIRSTSCWKMVES